MATFTGNILDFTGHARPGLFPVLNLRARTAAVQGGVLFFPVTEKPPIAADGSFSFSLINSADTLPYTIYDGWIDWVNGEGVPVGYEPLPGPFTPTGSSGNFGDFINTPPTALEVHIGETNDTTYGFWYQPSTATLWSNP